MEAKKMKRMCYCCCMMQNAVLRKYERSVNRLKDYLEHEKFKISGSIVYRFAV